MKPLSRIVLLLTATLVCFTAPPASPQATQQPPASSPLIAAGSGVNLGITRLLAKAFMSEHPEIVIEVPGSIGTKGAITAASEGAITFGLISRPLKEEEKSLGLTAHPYARVPVVLVAHPTVADDEVTYQEFVEIFKGTKSRWKDGNEIIVQTREPFDSGIQTLEKAIPGFREVYAESQQAKRWAVNFTDQDANRVLSTTPYAIGITDLGMIHTEQLNVKVLKVNGILPSPDTLSSGQYQLGRELSFIYRGETLPDPAKSFLELVRSEKGDRILRSNGYLPVN
ncbi:MAG: PstS family phosphate ABC transporter substrate-binding protein [Syntrophobacteraceae bacterium]